jgi:hypothetical protein
MHDCYCPERKFKVFSCQLQALNLGYSCASIGPLKANTYAYTHTHTSDKPNACKYSRRNTIHVTYNIEDGGSSSTNFFNFAVPYVMSRRPSPFTRTFSLQCFRL